MSEPFHWYDPAKFISRVFHTLSGRELLMELPYRVGGHLFAYDQVQVADNKILWKTRYGAHQGRRK